MILERQAMRFRLIAEQYAAFGKYFSMNMPSQRVKPGETTIHAKGISCDERCSR
jgi:hypothetical protein